jgi:hypothetical protein
MRLRRQCLSATGVVGIAAAIIGLGAPESAVRRKIQTSQYICHRLASQALATFPLNKVASGFAGALASEVLADTRRIDTTMKVAPYQRIKKRNIPILKQPR